jgi:hypothetical protein
VDEEGGRRSITADERSRPSEEDRKRLVSILYGIRAFLFLSEKYIKKQKRTAELALALCVHVGVVAVARCFVL